MLRAILSAALVLWGTASAAEPLTERNIERFIAVGETLQALDETYSDIDVDLPQENPQDLLEALISDEGELQLFAVISDQLSNHPEAGADFRKAISDEGFATTEEFADVADQIAITMLAMNFSRSDLDDLNELGGLSEGMLESLPAELRSMVERAKLFASAIEAVPEADIEMLRPYEDEIQNLGVDYGG